MSILGDDQYRGVLRFSAVPSWISVVIDMRNDTYEAFPLGLANAV